ncbi:MAG: coproporphyrinogen III oxidase, partial [Bacteroidetes bacterium HGW-Bacteroidetes-19]
MSGLYLHFPFCNSKCIYCSFYSIASLKNQKEFIDALLQEIELRKNDLQNDEIQTLYFGGGTPSLFSIDELSSIIDKLKQSFAFGSSFEFTFEANPEQCTIEYLTALQKLGINRLSIGIQSFNDDVLHFLGRKHDANHAILAVQNAQKAAFSNISIDLIYGILNRKVGEWQQDLDIALSLPIKHLSAYALTVEENTKLFKQLSKNLSIPSLIGKDQDEELAISDMKILLEAIKKSPFCRYEVS